MTNQVGHGMSRRHFLASTSLASAVGLLAPRVLFSENEVVSAPGLVEKARNTAASATINVQRLRGNISVLMGAGGNIAVLPGRDGKLLIDAGFAGARPKIAEALAGTGSDPIKHLINTHWHFDHTMGNATYLAAFPSIQIIAQTETQKLIAEVNNGALARYPQRKEKTEKALAEGKKSDGSPLTAGERKRYEKRLAGLTPTLEELKTAVQLAPNVSFDRELNVDLGHRLVQIRFLGRGHTAGDTIVYLPNEKILASGDLLVHPVPYLFGDISVDHANTLQLMSQLDVETIVPGHGEVLHGKDYIYQVMEFLKAVNAAVEREINAGATSSDEVGLMLPKAVDINSWREKFAGDDPSNASFFDANLHSLIASAFEQIALR